MWIVKIICGAESMCAAHKGKIQKSYAHAMRIVSKEIKTNPLNRMEYQKGQPEKYQVKDGK
jgi:hypothetical protein